MSLIILFTLVIVDHFLYFRMCLLSSSDHVLFYVPFTIASSSINCEDSALPLVCILFVFLIGNMQFMQTSICIRALTLDHLYCWVLAFLVFHIGFLKLNQHCLLKKERERESLWWAVFTEEHSAFTVPPPPPPLFWSTSTAANCLLQEASLSKTTTPACVSPLFGENNGTPLFTPIC